MINDHLTKDALLRVGEVSGIDGRKVYISVDKNKNSSDLLYNGQIIKNISVGSYIEISKGFLRIIGKVDGEKLEKELIHKRSEEGLRYEIIDKNKRTLTVSLLGYIGYDNTFVGGIKEMPLIGNEAFILTEEKVHKIHSLVKESTPLYINIAKTDIEEIDIELPIDGIFNSHIAIFGNTGSGKSNTLASMYQAMYKVMSDEHGSQFQNKCKFVLFDFNGEYAENDCITENKTVYNLATARDDGQKIPIKEDDLFDVGTFSILVEATEKTQKPFLKRALKFYKYVSRNQDSTPKSREEVFEHFKNILKQALTRTLQMTNKDVSFKLLDYIAEILSYYNTNADELRADIDFHNNSNSFYWKNPSDTNPHLNTSNYFTSNPAQINNTNIFQSIDGLQMKDRIMVMEKFLIILHLQLIHDLYQYKVQNDHVYPVVNRIKAKEKSICRVFNTTRTQGDIWNGKNFVVINLHDVNLDMKKTIPLLVARKIYNEHKLEDNKKTLNIIVDEAHNILSKSSFRETEEWKDYRVETFEEIIKEGRKFGVFMTIASQRPNDISETIISQAHNYFIHQLINHRDLLTISNAVSYIDKITEESIPTLPVGTCIFSGIATPMPLKLKVIELPDMQKPKSKTLKYSTVVNSNEA